MTSPSETPPPHAHRGGISPLARIAGGLVGIAGFILLGSAARTALATVPLPGAATITAAFLLLLGHYLVAAEAWRLILATGETDAPRSRLWRAWILSSYGAYLPGKIWAYAGRALLVRQEGVNLGSATASLVMETVLTIAAGGIWIIAAVPGRSDLALIAAVATLALLALLAPRLAIARCAKAPPRARGLFVGAFLLFLAAWALYGAGHLVLLNALFDLDPARLPQLTGWLAAAWIAGMAAVIFPAGIGVADGLNAWFFSAVLPVEEAMAAAVVCRGAHLASHAALALVLPLTRRRG